jgi:hypothetical protein
MDQNKKIEYFLVSKSFLELTEPIEETIRERNQSFKNSSKFFKDFWIINLEEISINEKITSVISKAFSKSKVYDKLNYLFFKNKLNTDKKGFIIVVSSDKIFVDWMNLKIPNLEKFNNIFTNKNRTYSADIDNIVGISGSDKFVRELIKKEEIWENCRSYI